MNANELNNIEKIREKYNFISDIDYAIKLTPGIDEEKVKFISKIKNEPEWMLNYRLKGYKWFKRLDMPRFGPKLNIDFDKTIYFAKILKDTGSKWEELPESIKETIDKLGIPEAERKWLSGSEVQIDSETVSRKIKSELEKYGIIFCSLDEAVQKYPDLVKKYFGRLVSYADHKLAALNWAVWSGGTFIYIPKGVKSPLPLQTYYRMNLEGIGQFERTLIIADEGSEVHYMEGCTAPLYSTSSLHASIVEVFALKGSKVRLSSVQNWSTNVYALMTKRAIAEENATVEWVAGNLGGMITMGYPEVVLKGDNSRGDILSIAIAGGIQEVDAGGKIIAIGKNTKSRVKSKSISLRGGKHTYRGLVRIREGAKNASVEVSCDALLLDSDSYSDAIPVIESYENDAKLKHEAKVGKIDDDALFYLTSKGISEKEAKSLLVLGFTESISKELPLEYALEFNKLVKMEIENGF